MIHSWVLIVTIAVNGGAIINQHDYANREACEAALVVAEQMIKDTKGYVNRQLRCIRKGPKND